MILHAGDLAYADCNQTLWDHYGFLTEPLAKSIPWMVGVGNHEIELQPDGRLFLAFEERYKMPAIKQAEYGEILIPASINWRTGMPYCCPSTFQTTYNYGNSFFSFSTGITHIIYLNPYSDTSVDSKQYIWLINDLETVNREKTPWIVIITHCPFYNSNKAHHNETQTYLMRESMESIFMKYEVDIVISGHVHAYERTHRVYKDEINNNAPFYIVIGDGGNLEGHATDYYDEPVWSAYRNGTQYGYGLLEFHDSKKGIWKWYKNPGINGIGDEYHFNK